VGQKGELLFIASPHTGFTSSQPAVGRFAMRNSRKSSRFRCGWLCQGSAFETASDLSFGSRPLAQGVGSGDGQLQVAYAAQVSVDGLLASPDDHDPGLHLEFVATMNAAES
jgi:hypothetical protein